MAAHTRWKWAAVITGALCFIAITGSARAQVDDDAALAQRIVQLHNERKYEEGVEVAKRLLALREKALGPNHPAVAWAVGNLGAFYSNLRRYSEAEPLLKRSLTIFEKDIFPDDRLIAHALYSLAVVLNAQLRPEEAKPLYRRALELREKILGPIPTSPSCSSSWLR